MSRELASRNPGDVEGRGIFKKITFVQLDRSPHFRQAKRPRGAKRRQARRDGRGHGPPTHTVLRAPSLSAHSLQHQLENRRTVIRNAVIPVSGNDLDGSRSNQKTVKESRFGWCTWRFHARKSQRELISRLASRGQRRFALRAVESCRIARLPLLRSISRFSLLAQHLTTVRPEQNPFVCGSPSFSSPPAAPAPAPTFSSARPFVFRSPGLKLPFLRVAISSAVFSGEGPSRACHRII